MASWDIIPIPEPYHPALATTYIPVRNATKLTHLGYAFRIRLIVIICHVINSR